MGNYINEVFVHNENVHIIVYLLVKSNYKYMNVQIVDYNIII